MQHAPQPARHVNAVAPTLDSNRRASSGSAFLSLLSDMGSLRSMVSLARQSPMPAPNLSSLRIPAIAFLFGTSLLAQWSPTTGQWGRQSPTDLRVMTWNMLDAICSTNVKNSATNNWAAAARIIAAMQPDVLILQECGDNSGNGTGSTADTQAQLTTTVGMFLRGGIDTFRANAAITQHVQAFAPGYDLPYVHVSSVSDGFNRNIILSRYPFLDLTGDGQAIRSDTPTITADLYAPGGNGGIRGYMWAEIDLPDATYAGDLVVGNAHFKAGSTTSDLSQRMTAAQNIAYYIDYMWNGAGGAAPDSRARIADSPAATRVLGPNTVVITGGDLNEDETTNTRVGPVQWLASGPVVDGAGTDGTDRNRTDMKFDQSVEPFTSNRTTFQGSNYKPDYLLWQDSICALRRSFVFDSARLPNAAAMPSQIAGFTGGGGTASFVAADHLPVVGDFVMPLALGCNSAAVDLGFASLSGSGQLPRYSVCGGLAGGQTGTFTLTKAPANTAAYLGVSLTQGIQLAFGGTLVPSGAEPIGPFFTDASGQAQFTYPGGLPFSLVTQWAIVDAGAASGVSLSNALRLNFLP